MVSWGGGGGGVRSEFLGTHKCTPEELGLEGSNSKFYPITENSYGDIDYF